MKFYFLIIFHLFFLFSCAQEHTINMIFGAGPGYFFNDPRVPQLLGYTKCIGFNYVYSTKNKVFAFSPGINLQTNSYRSCMDDDYSLHVDQTMFNFTTDVLLRLNKKTFLRVGLLFNGVFNGGLSVSKGSYNSYNSNNAIFFGYSETNFQAGITAGLTFPFVLFNHTQKFDIKLMQIETPLVNHDYEIKNPSGNNMIKILSVKARPVFLLLAFEFNLATPGKHPASKEEEE